jgi:hypothetical protein
LLHGHFDVPVPGIRRHAPSLTVRTVIGEGNVSILLRLVCQELKPPRGIEPGQPHDE